MEEARAGPDQSIGSVVNDLDCSDWVTVKQAENTGRAGKETAPPTPAESPITLPGLNKCTCKTNKKTELEQTKICY